MAGDNTTVAQANPSEDIENLRCALNMSVVLSSQLILASLTMLTVASGAWIFVADKREGEACFVIVALLSAISFICSVIQGGLGINYVRNAVFQGKWTLEAGRANFNAQALFCFLGFALFALSLTSCIAGKKNEEDTDRRVDDVVSKLSAANASITSLQKSESTDTKEMRQRLTALEENIQLIQKTLPPIKVDSKADQNSK